MSIIFPDIETLIVAHLNTKLSEQNTELTSNVRVGVKKLPADVNQPAKQVVITGAYTQFLDEVRKAATVTIDVWADHYQTASDLALMVGALIVTITDDPIKKCVVTLGPLRLSEESQEEHRALTAELIVKGSNL